MEDENCVNQFPYAVLATGFSAIMCFCLLGSVAYAMFIAVFCIFDVCFSTIPIVAAVLFYSRSVLSFSFFNTFAYTKGSSL